MVDAPSFKVPNAAVPSDLRINEFMASNTNGALDETGTLEDWVEIYNAGGSTLDLTGLFLTDDVDGASPWAFPAGTLLPAGQTLLVWADEDPLDGPLHASFKLSKGGEEVALGMPGHIKGMATMLIPLGRAGTPQDAAGAILLLASPYASYITGQCLNVTGGLSA